MQVVLNTIRTKSPILWTLSMIMLALAALSFIGLFVDDRTLLGVNVWVKPLKFELSTAIYTLTLSFLATFYPYSEKKRKRINGIVAWTLFIEMLIVPLQAFRGVQSHFNQSTPFDGILFAMMGLLISVNVLVMFLLLIDSIRLRLNLSMSQQIAIILGWIIVIGGSWVGGQMLSEVGHNIGVADGGEGLPIINWSTIAGDLRVAHFFGLHGIQVLPLFALLLVKKWNTKESNRVIGVLIFGLCYAGWIAYTFYQAKQGIPLIALP